MPKCPGIFAKLKPWEFSEFKGNPGIVKVLKFEYILMVITLLSFSVSVFFDTFCQKII
jgi:hypothetical protein